MIIEAIISYPYLFTPQKGKGANARDAWSAAYVMTPEHQKTEWFKALQEAAIKAGTAKFGPDFLDRVRLGKLKPGFRKDIEGKGYPEGSVYINARNYDTAPTVVDKYIDPTTGKLRRLGAKEIWAGCLVKADVTPYGYDHEMNKGVTFGLGNLQLWDNTLPRFDGRKSADDTFEGTLNEVPADLSQFE